MADSFSFDFDELNVLSADIAEAAESIEPLVEKALGVTSGRIKKASARAVGKRRHFRQAAQAIDYEIKKFSGFGANVIQSEVGYDKGKPAGELGNLVEYGAPGSPNALAPGSELVTALHAEEEDFVRGLETALDQSMRKGGL
ncbi:hypothetical protein [uncultured Microbacterium sp.]|uniref:hypothetical protein n=1 Tax=uncultured Microbacterium sp. TaxID=191216 RepID=UPI0026019765|nr:hypothetical protein [uncultured Microbacterium sp.]